MKTIKAAVISNGIEGLKKYFVSNDLAEYKIIEVEKNFNRDLSACDMATTLDPIVKHGVQQITHLNHYVDKLIFWLIGVIVSGEFEIPALKYGVAIN